MWQARDVPYYNVEINWQRCVVLNGKGHTRDGVRVQLVANLTLLPSLATHYYRLPEPADSWQTKKSPAGRKPRQTLQSFSMGLGP